MYRTSSNWFLLIMNYPLPLKSDPHLISPYNIITLSSRQVTRIKTIITWRKCLDKSRWKQSTVKPCGPNKDESCWEFKLSLLFGLKLSCTLIDSHRIWIWSNFSWEFSCREFSLVWPTLDDSRWELTKILMRANSHPRLARALNCRNKTTTSRSLSLNL